MSHPRPTGVLLVNLGTPDSPETGDVRRYLREFLSDPRVLDMPALGRWLLLNAVILPFRPRVASRAYRAIWTSEGSPLLVHGLHLAEALAKRLDGAFRVELAMRYGRPDVESALGRLVAADVEAIVVVPLFPQYSAAAWGSAAEHVFDVVGRSWNVPPLSLVEPFYADPSFIGASARIARPLLDEFGADTVLFSYHGLPERQVRRSDPTGRHCLAQDDCCATLGPANRFCYRAQCFATSRALAAELGLADGGWQQSFQSRLGRTPWLRPYTDHVLPELAKQGVQRLAVLCPSFVADCLETVEEIGIRARDQWRELGGEELLLVPCVNDHPLWVEGLATRLRAAVIPDAMASDTATPSR